MSEEFDRLVHQAEVVVDDVRRCPRDEAVFVVVDAFITLSHRVASETLDDVRARLDRRFITPSELPRP